MSRTMSITKPRPAPKAKKPALRDEPATRAGDEEPASGSAERTLRLMALLAEEGRPMTLAELTAQLQLPKVTVHRLCANLVAGGFLVRDLDERSFTIGPALRELAFNALNHGTLRGLRHAVLKTLVDQIGETCNFTTLDGAEVLYLDRVEARRALRLTIDVGAHVPLHCSASGKLLLAHMPRRQRDTVIRRIPLTALTAHTLTTPEALRAECDEILAQGFARDREEFVPGLIALAVPVRDAQQAVRATIAVHAPVARLSMAEAEARLDALQRAAEAMGRLL
jgi:IclR family transcriptional regulator, acetate operon repressor